MRLAWSQALLVAVIIEFALAAELVPVLPFERVEVELLAAAGGPPLSSWAA